MSRGRFGVDSRSSLLGNLPVYRGFYLSSFSLTFKRLLGWMFKFGILCISTFACNLIIVTSQYTGSTFSTSGTISPSSGPHSRYNILFAVSVCNPILVNFFTLDSRRSCQTKERDTKTRKGGRRLTCVALAART